MTASIWKYSVSWKCSHLIIYNLKSICLSIYLSICLLGFSDSSVGKKSACNAGDPSSIPGWGRSPGEGIGYPFQYSWTSFVAQLVKNLPGLQETWVQSLGWEDPLEKGKVTHSNHLYIIQSMGSQRVRNNWATFTFIYIYIYMCVCKAITTKTTKTSIKYQYI